MPKPPSGPRRRRAGDARHSGIARPLSLPVPLFRRSTDDAYRPVSGRRRLLLLVLAVATAGVVLWLMLQPQMRKMQADAQRRSERASPQPCRDGQTDGCVGGTMGVIVAPAAAPAPAASR